MQQPQPESEYLAYAPIALSRIANSAVVGVLSTETSYHDAHKVFPPGAIWTGVYIDWFGAHHRTNWALALLPHMEEQTLYDQYDSACRQFRPHQSTRRGSVRRHSLVSKRDRQRRREYRAAKTALLCRGKTRYQYGSYRGVAGRSELPYTMGKLVTKATGCTIWDGGICQRNGEVYFTTMRRNTTM